MEEEKGIFSKIFMNERYGPTSIFYLVLFCAAICVVCFIKWGFNIYTIILGVIAILFCLIYSILVLSRNSIPRAKKGSFGILAVVVSENKSEFEDTNRKFIELLKNEIQNENISVVLLPYEKYSFWEKSTLEKVLKKTKCEMVLKINVNFEALQNERIYKVYFKFKSKNNIIDEFVKMIEKNYSFNNLSFKDKDKLDMLEISSEEISYISRFIISYYYCKTEKYNEFKEIVEELYISMNNNRIDRNIYIRKIRDTVEILCYQVNMFFAAKQYELFLSKKDKINLDNSEAFLLKANSYKPNTYSYNLNMASVIFLKYRDIDKSIKFLNSPIMNNNKKSKLHKYSMAFLNLFKNPSEYKVVISYRNAFKDNYNMEFNSNNINDLICFIEDFTTKEEQKNTKIYLALALLNLENKNKDKFKFYMEKYFINKGLKIFNKSASLIINDRYGIDLKEEFNGLELEE